MINLASKDLQNGMVTAQSIYNSTGASYLTKGTKLNSQYITRLKKLGVKSLSVTSLNPDMPLPPPEDIVQENTRVTAIHRVFATFQELEESGRFDIDSLQNSTESILVDLVSQRKNLVQITDIRMHDSYTFAHSVNVAILSAMLGTIYGYNEKEIFQLTLGGLLHDIGKIIIPAEILNKPTSLTDEEFAIIRTHPEAGRRKLRELNVPIASLIATIAAQHHEHMDGTGYPNHLQASSIHRFARITAIADVYDALSSNRPYKKSYRPHVVHRIMTTCSQGQFDEDLLNKFFDNVAIYPIGTVMKTKFGYAIVKRVDFGHTKTPIICVFADENTHLLTKPFNVDLTQCPADTIETILEDNELYKLTHLLGIDPAAFILGTTG